jgi:hypothetical protein
MRRRFCGRLVIAFVMRQRRVRNVSQTLRVRHSIQTARHVTPSQRPAVERDGGCHESGSKSKRQKYGSRSIDGGSETVGRRHGVMCSLLGSEHSLGRSPLVSHSVKKKTLTLTPSASGLAHDGVRPDAQADYDAIVPGDGSLSTRFVCILVEIPTTVRLPHCAVAMSGPNDVAANLHDDWSWCWACLSFHRVRLSTRSKTRTRASKADKADRRASHAKTSRNTSKALTTSRNPSYGAAACSCEKNSRLL